MWHGRNGAVYFAGLFLFLFQHLAVQASSGSCISQLEVDGWMLTQLYLHWLHSFWFVCFLQADWVKVFLFWPVKWPRFALFGCWQLSCHRETYYWVVVNLSFLLCRRWWVREEHHRKTNEVSIWMSSISFIAVIHSMPECLNIYVFIYVYIQTSSVSCPGQSSLCCREAT